MLKLLKLCMLTYLSNYDLNVYLLWRHAVWGHYNATSNDVTLSVIAAFKSQNQHSYIKIEVERKTSATEILKHYGKHAGLGLIRLWVDKLKSGRETGKVTAVQAELHV